jgi:hypothetical protein
MLNEMSAANYAFMAIGVVALGAALYAMDEQTQTHKFTSTIERKFVMPTVAEEKRESVIRIRNVPGLQDNKLFAPSDFFGKQTEAGLSMWKTLRPGCQYKFVVHNANPRGSTRYEIRQAQLVSCS